MSANRWAASVIAVLALVGCGAAAPAQPEVVLAGPVPESSRPLDGVEMSPGTTYRFADVLPYVLDVDVTIPAPGMFAFVMQTNTYVRLPGRSVDVRQRPGTGSVPCTISAPERGSCAVLVYGRVYPSIWLLSERVLRVAEVLVGDESLTVITSTDDGGEAFAESLVLTELED